MTVKMYLQLSYSHHSLFEYLGGTQSLSPYITETQMNYQQAHRFTRTFKIPHTRRHWYLNSSFKSLSWAKTRTKPHTKNSTF